MKNSLVFTLGGYVENLFKDLFYTYRSSHEWERDKSRSLHELVNRGERFLTIDLPALRKHLEKCLEEGMYSPSKLFLSRRVSKAVVVPAFGRDLYLQIFDAHGKLRDQPSYTAIADLRQLFEGFGKLKSPCKSEVVDEEVANFLKNEKDLRIPTLDWRADYLYENSGCLANLNFDDSSYYSRRLPDEDLLGVGDPDGLPDPRSIHILQRVCDTISSSFGDFHSERSGVAPEVPKHGSGRVSNLRKGVNKFTFNSWPKKLDNIFPFDMYGVSDLGYSTYMTDLSRRPRNHEDPSKLIAVPKTASGPRLIGSEPNYHQWTQQLVRNQIEARIVETPLRFCITFGDQSTNRYMALKGSMDGSLATVDLKSASDRLSCWTIERALRSNSTLLERIHACRTRTMTNAINDHFSTIYLKKCFTQGSACTFPVQTVVYAMVAISAVLASSEEENGTTGKISYSRICNAARKVQVFGDDIIIPTKALRKLQEMLSFLQLIVNPNKTFSKGKFRESCGLDAYDGVDVTPARVKRFSCNPSHEVAQSMIMASNNFHEKGMWNVAQWLQSYIGKYQLPIVRIRESDGLSSFCGRNYSHLRKRWNSVLHREEVQTDILVSKAKKSPSQTADDLSEFLFRTNTKEARSLEHLSPLIGGLGVVDTTASVMRRSWQETKTS